MFVYVVRYVCLPHFVIRLSCTYNEWVSDEERSYLRTQVKRKMPCTCKQLRKYWILDPRVFGWEGGREGAGICLKGLVNRPKGNCSDNIKEYG